MGLNQRELVDNLKAQWKRLWQERLADRIRAEEVAVSTYNQLFIDKGTVIHATRDYKALNFKDILEKNAILQPERYNPPDPQIGGWTKFAKTHITNQQTKTKQTQKQPALNGRRKKRQLKKNGRGWLHI